MPFQSTRCTICGLTSCLHWPGYKETIKEAIDTGTSYKFSSGPRFDRGLSSYDLKVLNRELGNKCRYGHTWMGRANGLMPDICAICEVEANEDDMRKRSQVKKQTADTEEIILARLQQGPIKIDDLNTLKAIHNWTIEYNPTIAYDGRRGFSISALPPKEIKDAKPVKEEASSSKTR